MSSTNCYVAGINSSSTPTHKHAEACSLLLRNLAHSTLTHACWPWRDLRDPPWTPEIWCLVACQGLQGPPSTIHTFPLFVDVGTATSATHAPPLPVPSIMARGPPRLAIDILPAVSPSCSPVPALISIYCLPVPSSSFGSGTHVKESHASGRSASSTRNITASPSKLAPHPPWHTVQSMDHTSNQHVGEQDPSSPVVKGQGGHALPQRGLASRWTR